MAKKSSLSVGLDLGSFWTRVVVLSLEGDVLRYRGHAALLSRGWTRGRIADQSAVGETIRQAIRDAETSCGEQIGSAVVGIGGPDIRSQQGRGLYDFGHRRPIESGDLAYAVELAARARLDEDRALIQVLPQDFTVDGRAPVQHPLGVDCLRLEAHALLITALQHDHQALLNAVHQAHLRIEETVYEAFAASYAGILADERHGGVVLADLGRHSSGLVFHDGDIVLYATGTPISGDHFTRDVGEMKALNLEEAERLKIAHGCALVGLSADNTIIELPGELGRSSREINRRDLVEILEARASQFFNLVERCRARFARETVLREGVVLVGGGAQLEGMVEVAEKALGCPARLGFARGIAGWPEDLTNPSWTVAAGLAMYSARLHSRRERPSGPTFWTLVTGR